MWWEIGNEKIESKKDYIAKIKYDKIVCLKANNFMDIVNGELEEKIQYRIITEQSFNAISVIEYLHKFNKINENKSNRKY